MFLIFCSIDAGIHRRLGAVLLGNAGEVAIDLIPAIARVRVVSLPLMIVAVLPADRWLLRWVMSPPSALPREPLALQEMAKLNIDVENIFLFY
ncbi:MULTISPECIES: hypothetical protein [Xanthomonas]|uniref:hypothetical protein n=1 Tax=Xanthomonas TaxID=338 RepID=UPI0006F2A7A0|nr:MULTISPECIES: hypothetical protein [Xanthomonas]KQR15480.1 hypothetical protein ASF90_21000 [Xanthomonas sp. Leaf148]